MEEPKFTKGEWIIERECDCTMIHDNSEDEFFVAKVSQNWNNHEANARLICASPELFEALYNLIQLKAWKDEQGKDEHYLRCQPFVWEDAKRAISKALGL